MKLVSSGYRVAVVGASSLLGKELLTVLEERKFPVSRLVTLGADAGEPDLPVLDLNREPSDLSELGDDLEPTDLAATGLAESAADTDFIFLARPPSPSVRNTMGTEPLIIDLGENHAMEGAVGPVRAPDERLSIPFLDRELGPARPSEPASDVSRPRWNVSPHPASIMISSLLLRLANLSPVRLAVAQVFGPASEIGPRAIEELQKQTLNLLSFQKIPQSVFGAQLAFNVLPRLGRSRRGDASPYRDGLTDLESRIRTQVRSYLAGRACAPALRVIQVPVFYSLTVSLYVETETPLAPQSIGQALGSRIRLRKISEPAASPIDVAGASDILVDAITADSEHPNGIWLWAAADNLRLAAVNAVEIAESFMPRNAAPRGEGAKHGR